MKLLASLLILGSFCFSAQAQQNPLLRVCNQNEAAPHIYLTSLAPYDETVFCDFDSGALIDAMSLLLNKEGSTTAAASAFLNSSSCNAAGGEAILLKDLESEIQSFCTFEDASYISIPALTGGPSQNPRLHKALLN